MKPYVHLFVLERSNGEEECALLQIRLDEPVRISRLALQHSTRAEEYKSWHIMAFAIGHQTDPSQRPVLIHGSVDLEAFSFPS